MLSIFLFIAWSGYKDFFHSNTNSDLLVTQPTPIVRTSKSKFKQADAKSKCRVKNLYTLVDLKDFALLFIWKHNTDNPKLGLNSDIDIEMIGI